MTKLFNTLSFPAVVARMVSAKFPLGYSAYQGNTSRIFVLHNWLSVGPYSVVLGYGMPFRLFSSSSSLNSIHYSFKGTVWNPVTKPLPPTENYYGIPMVSIYSSNFLDLLFENIKTILASSSHSSPLFNFIIEVLLHSGSVRTVGHGFKVNSNTNLEELRTTLAGYIENFETQSGIPEERKEQEVISSLIKVFNRSHAPHVDWSATTPLAGLPESTLSPETPKVSKRTAPKATAEKLAILNSQINTGFTTLQTNLIEAITASNTQMTEQIVNAIKSTPANVSQSSAILDSVNWTPILHGITNVIVTSLGGSPVQFPSVPAPTPAVQTPGEVQVASSPLETQIKALESKISSMETKFTSLESVVTQLAASTNNQISKLASSIEATNNQVSELASSSNASIERLASLMETQIKGTSNGNGNNSNGSSSAPASPVQNTPPATPKTRTSLSEAMAALHAKNLAKTESALAESQQEYFSPISGAGKFNIDNRIEEMGFNPFIAPEEYDYENEKIEDSLRENNLLTNLPEIENLVASTKKQEFTKNIVAADLEALITPQGKNHVYMAAWYNGTTHKIFDITQFGFNNQTMLEQFWIDLINQNIGRTCYFHNFGGYDAILSLPALLHLPYTFSPILKDGEIISIKVFGKKEKLLLTIKDSIRILPGALSKLAKDWRVETQKDHFPHYFWDGSIKETLNYVGFLPDYKYFEPKRTSQKDYEEMKEEYLNKYWSFLNVSRQYILGDVKALFQILIAFFDTIVSKFPIDPLKVYSAPSTAFRIWRTVQLPLLLKENLKVYDLSHSLDSQLRDGYCGGIVDVYRPHLQGVGYYYDVNSLYPTAMLKPMPVGIPQLIPLLTVNQFLEGNFFGFLEATIKAPAEEYIGLLSIKIKGRLICPGGTFSGLFFSEELRFALANGYTLLSIKVAYQFKRGDNTFLQLINQLNSMKIEAQKNNQPTIRNLAKLLMNSMYGRFGMHPSLTQHHIYTEEEILNIAPHWQIENQIDFGELHLITALLDREYLLKTHGEEVLKKSLEKLGNKTNVAIAAAVTAYSRIIINNYKLLALNLGLELYYSDTDSLVLNGPLPPEHIDSATLGKLKLEHTIKEGIFVMPKVYYLEDIDGNIITKCKGYPGRLSKSQYLNLLEGRTLQLEVTKWSRSLNESYVKILREQPYKLTFSFNKRQQVLNAQGQWINTRPLQLN